MNKVEIRIGLTTDVGMGTPPERRYQNCVIGDPQSMHDSIDTLKQWFSNNISSWLKNEIEVDQEQADV